jgi:hypothetical protein
MQMQGGQHGPARSRQNSFLPCIEEEEEAMHRKLPGAFAIDRGWSIDGDGTSRALLRRVGSELRSQRCVFQLAQHHVAYGRQQMVPMHVFFFGGINSLLILSGRLGITYIVDIATFARPLLRLIKCIPIS